ncbi:hypothetical protein KBY97_02920 [Synechococcus sp. ATX 2A4]|uniref:Hfq-related RNA-binding protein n=1 Tax=Synechococcus sp. ATX 2A4 TaxID=2823727 RepID=UPI0020CD2228|nr:hypothetical protein [Synechococcus sp. ATX 2A4]MCP9884083.1 hypothetical protein [Synechococcus sp. ATX 2A4]
MEITTLDPSLPGVRQLQQWIRGRNPLELLLVDSVQVTGTLLWQDPEFLALRGENDADPVLINRRMVVSIRTTS